MAEVLHDDGDLYGSAIRMAVAAVNAAEQSDVPDAQHREFLALGKDMESTIFATFNNEGGRTYWYVLAVDTTGCWYLAAPISQTIVFAGLSLVVYKVFYANYRRTGQRPSWNLLIPFIALYVWWLPQTRQYEFYFLLTPLFHSLQYLAFVYKMEDTRLRGLSHPEVRGTILAFSIVLAGRLAFEFVPNEVDTALGTFNSWQMFFFFTAAMLFINIHHYFIDNVLWRFRDPRVKAYLLS